MKKFNVLFTALLCASVMFVGCSDDEDENGEDPGNGGDSGIVILPKKVVRVIETDTWSEGSNIDTTFYAYNAEGRLSKIIDLGEDDVTNITYTSNKITLTSDNSTETIELKDGKAIKSVGKYNNGGDHEELTYSYSDNYISKIIWNDFDIQDGVTITDSYEGLFSIKDGNLVKVEYDFLDEDESNETISFEISNIDNNMNIDLMYGDITEPYEDATLLCVTGDRFKKLPSKETYTEEGYEDDEYDIFYKYEVNKDGYVTKITITEDDDVTVYDITYED